MYVNRGMIEAARTEGEMAGVMAHELAHVATPEDREHGEAWKAAFDRIFEEYNRIAQDLFGEGGEEPC